MLTDQEIATAINTTNNFLAKAERFISSMDEVRQTCQICHARRREFDWIHSGNKRCGWRKICHRCFLKVKICPFCKHKVDKNK